MKNTARSLFSARSGRLKTPAAFKTVSLFLTKGWSLKMFSHFWPRSRHYSSITMGERCEEAKKKAAHPTHKTFTAFDPRAISVSRGKAGRSVSLWKMYEWVTGAWYSQTVKGGEDRSSLGWDNAIMIKQQQQQQDRNKIYTRKNEQVSLPPDRKQTGPQRTSLIALSEIPQRKSHTAYALKRLQWCSNRANNRNRKALWN